jgi:hypothetical protein
MKPQRRWSWLGWAGVLLLAGVLVGVWACNGKVPSTTEQAENAGPPLFQDVTESSGVAITYHNGEEAGHFAILESLGGGVALIDYDGDGLYDLFITGGGAYAGTDQKEIKGLPCKLYRNLGNCKFQDVTREVGLDRAWFYTHGAAVTDYDNDGWPDLLVTGWQHMALYHNEPVDPNDPSKGRHFVEKTQEAGLPPGLWTTSAAWADFDGDGFPDLYVCQYVNWSLANNPTCNYDGKTRDVCPPKNFTALPHKVFHNNGNGTFTDVSNEAGLRMPRDEKDYQALTWLRDLAEQEAKASSSKDELEKLKNPNYGGHYIEQLKRADVGTDPEKDKGKDFGKGLGVLAVDLNGDGKPDVYVANDTVDNLLYINCSVPGKIRFKEVGMASGTARDDRGSPNGSMGLDIADFDRGGKPSIWVTNYEGELHALYVNMCDKNKTLFRFGTQASGIAAIGQTYVGFGTGFLDVDNDGWEDIFISNGHAIRFPTGRAHRAQRPVLLHNEGKGKFKNLSDQGGTYFKSNNPEQYEHVGRGVGVGDLDNDGRIDLVISHINQPVSVLHNIADTGNHWIGFELAGRNNRDVVGARLILEAGDAKRMRFAKGGGSYLSSGDPRHVFGLGKLDKIDSLTVIWPSGEEQVWKGLATDRYWRLVEAEPEAQKPRGHPDGGKKE